MIKTYSELITIPTFNERLKYLQLNGEVGKGTFEDFRIFNQKFYTSYEWRRFRNHIIVRDNGCDLGVEGCDIPKGVYVLIHHLEPITLEDIQLERFDKLLNPENVITTILNTHNQIHYGLQANILPLERTPNDTCPWKK